MRPALSPENIYAHRHDEQDVLLWYNRALWHSIVSFRGPVEIFSLMLSPDGISRVLWPEDHAPVQHRRIRSSIWLRRIERGDTHLLAVSACLRG